VNNYSLLMNVYKSFYEDYPEWVLVICGNFRGK